MLTGEWQTAAGCVSDNHCVEVKDWFKAEKSCAEGHCVECKFISASACTNGHCVEFSAGELHANMVIVRDSKEKDKPDPVYLHFTHREWKEYLNGLKLGYGAIISEDVYLICKGIKYLSFSTDEWTAFMDGVHKGEFDVPVS